MPSWSITDEFSIMQKLRRRLRQLSVVLLVASYSLLFAGAAAIRHAPGQYWGHAAIYNPKGLLPSSVFLEAPSLVKNDQNYHLNLHSSISLNQPLSTQPAKITQVQVLRRKKESAAGKECKRRRGKGGAKRRVSHKLHEVPSGPNPISNEIPTKLVHAQNTPTSMP